MATGEELPVPFKEVEISISARCIRDRDLFSISDPMCVLYIKKPCSDKFVEFGRTEVVLDMLDPDFVKKFKLDYFYNEKQELKFELFDNDASSEDLTRHDKLGQVCCYLDEIVSKKTVWREIQSNTKFSSKRKSGTLVISVEDVGDSNDLITLQFKGQKLDNKDRFSKSDPYLTFYRTNDDESKTIVYRTETIMDTLNPTWRPFTVPLRTLCADDFQRKICIYCWDYDHKAKDSYIGACETTVNSLKQEPKSANVTKFINRCKKEKSSKYDNSGLLSLLECNIEKKYSFADFTRCGTRMHFTVAIDLSNPAAYQDAYESVLTSISESLEYYDRTKIYRALGFGAKTKDSNDISDFFLNGPSNPCCKGVEEIIASYREKLIMTMSTSSNDDPVDLVPVIEQSETFARTHGDDDNYFVLLLLTSHYDTITMAKTKDAIMAVAGLPLSIVIVGIGNDHFDKSVMMKEEAASSEAERKIDDIAHFVRFHDFVDYETKATSKDRLARAVFKKLPDQFLYYMTNVNDVKPRYI
ncbi:copine-8-like [Glandiceps talaboti]